MQEEILFNRRLRTIVGVRHDRFGIDVYSAAGGPHGRLSPAFIGPKASVIVSRTGTDDVQLFANYGRGFHSNDACASAIRRPPSSRLQTATSSASGARSLAAWSSLRHGGRWISRAEFTWVGDEGITEGGGATRRRGVELEAWWRVVPPLWAEVDLTASRRRYREVMTLWFVRPCAPTDPQCRCRAH